MTHGYVLPRALLFRVMVLLAWRKISPPLPPAELLPLVTLPPVPPYALIVPQREMLFTAPR